MKFTATSFDGVWIIEPGQRHDERGFFAHTYCGQEFTAHALNPRWVQQNHTLTKTRGSVRGMHWHAVELSAQTMCALYIPAGFAHGFQCLEDVCELFYLISEFYHADLALGVRCDDPRGGITWPLPVVNLSARDAALPHLHELA